MTLHSDYEILFHTIKKSLKHNTVCVDRIRSILPDIISGNRFAFVPNRNTDEPLRLISDILDNTQKSKFQEFFAADYAAAFDSLNLAFIISTLKIFGFLDYLITW